MDDDQDFAAWLDAVRPPRTAEESEREWDAVSKELDNTAGMLLADQQVSPNR